MDNLIQAFAEFFRYDFVWKALLTGSLIAVCSALLGVFLVLRKYSLIGDGLAHVGFASAALALLFSVSPLFLTIPLSIIAAFLILKLNEKARLHGDAAIGLISSFSVAVGVLIASVAKGFNVDLMSFLFGSILLISDTDVWVSVALAAVIIFLVFFFYHSLFAISYDEEFARVSGVKVKRVNALMIILTAVTISLGIRVVGTMLISSLIIFPAVSALQVAKSFRSALFISALTAVVCVVIGVTASFFLNLPTGATIVVLNAVAFGVFFIAGRTGARA